MMGMPTVEEAHRKLKSLAGSWTGAEKIYPSPWDPAGGPATSRVESRIDLDGFFLVCDYVEERGGQVSYRGHGVFGYDPAEKCYTMHWFDSMGSPCHTAAKGSWEGNKLTFSQRNPMGHSRYTYTIQGDRSYHFQIEQSQDGRQWAPFMEGTYTKK